MAPPVLRLLRWPGILTAAADAATIGLLFAPCADGRVWALGAAAAAAYAGGVVLNDRVDLARDRTLHPDRPLPSGAVRPGAASGVAAGLLLAAPLLGLGAGTHAAAAYVGVVVLVLAYDLVLKRHGLAGAFGMGLCRGGSALAAAMAFPEFRESLAAAPGRALVLPLPWFLHGLLVTWASLQEDRSDAARRVPAAAAAAVLGPALALVLLRDGPLLARPVAVVPAILLAAAVGVAAAAARRRGGGAGVGLIVREGVFGFLLVDGAALAARLPHPGFALGACSAWAALRFALARRRS